MIQDSQHCNKWLGKHKTGQILVIPLAYSPRPSSLCCVDILSQNLHWQHCAQHLCQYSSISLIISLWTNPFFSYHMLLMSKNCECDCGVKYIHYVFHNVFLLLLYLMSDNFFGNIPLHLLHGTSFWSPFSTTFISHHSCISPSIIFPMPGREVLAVKVLAQELLLTSEPHCCFFPNFLYLFLRQDHQTCTQKIQIWYIFSYTYVNTYCICIQTFYWIP